MSRDFSPKQCWLVNKESSQEIPFGIYLQNFRWNINGEDHWAYTDEELLDRRNHKYLAVTGADLYKDVRNFLTNENFEKLNTLLGEMIEADDDGKCTSSFPKEMTAWYFNRNNHYYHEPNDEEFLDYIRREWK